MFRQRSDYPISALHIALQALDIRLSFLWRVDARRDDIPELVALAGQNVLTKVLVFQFICHRLREVINEYLFNYFCTGQHGFGEVSLK